MRRRISGCRSLALPLLRQVLQSPDLEPDSHLHTQKLLALAYGRSARWEQAVAVLEALHCESTPEAESLRQLAYAQKKAGLIAASPA